MADVHDGNALALEVFDDLEQRLRLRLGEGGSRLVHDDAAGVPRKGAADLDHLLLADGEVAGDGFGGEAHPQALQDLGRIAVQLFVVDKAALHRQVADIQVFGHIKLGGDGQLLIHAGDAVRDALCRRVDVHRLTVDKILTAVGLVRAGHYLDQGRLAGAVLAAEGMAFTGVDSEADVAQCLDAGKDLGDVPQLDQRNAFVGHKHTSYYTYF